MVEKLGVVLARIRSAPWNKNSNIGREPRGSARPKLASRGDKWGRKPTKRRIRKRVRIRKEERLPGVPYKRTAFNPDKFCIAHQTYGHAPMNAPG